MVLENVKLSYEKDKIENEPKIKTVEVTTDKTYTEVTCSERSWNSFLEFAFLVWTLGSNLLQSVLFEEGRLPKQPKQ